MATLSSMLGGSGGVKKIIKGTITIPAGAYQTTAGVAMTLSFSLGQTVVPSKCVVDVPALAMVGVETNGSGLIMNKGVTAEVDSNNLILTSIPTFTTNGWAFWYNACSTPYYTGSGYAAYPRSPLSYTITEYN